MATGAEAAAVNAVASSCLACCCNQFESYIIQAEKNVSDLEQEAEKLAAMARDVEIEVSGKPLSSVNLARNWLGRSGAVGMAADKLSEECRSMCFPRVNFWSRYIIGKRAFRELMKAKGLAEERAKLEIPTTVSQEDSLQVKQIETMVVGMDPYMEIALNYISSTTVGIIGICGMGGVGKTTLLRKIHGEFLPGKATRSKKFDKILWVVVMKKSTDLLEKENDVVMLQNDIARELGLVLDQVPENFTKELQERRALPIYEYLCTKSFLLFLDDLWSPLDLRSIGVPDPNSNAGSHKHKLVLTSRSEVVCGQMHAASGLINVRCLQDSDARRLFEFNVTKQTIESHKDIPELALQVMRECQGLPLALNTIGKALSTKKGDPRPWKGALDKLRAASHVDIPGMETENASMLKRLKISYDYLPSERDKICFLSCCLWPEDLSIEEAKLIECWLGLGIIPESSGVITGSGIIRSLKEVHLLDSGYDDATEVKMHDTIRDMALWISSDCGKTKNKWLVKAGIGISTAQMVLRQWHQGSAATEWVSLMNNLIEELPSEHVPERSKLQVLMLQKNTQLRSVPSSFLQCAPALTYLDLSNTGIEELPSEIRSLHGLQYLNLSESHITRLPDELPSLTELRYLLVSATISLATMPYGIISKLRKLQTLDVFQSKYTSWDYTDSETDDHSCLEEFKARGKSLKRLGITLNTASALKKLAQCELVSINRLCLKQMHTPPSLHIMPSSLAELLGCFDMLKSLQEFMLSTCPGLKEVVIDGGSDDPSNPTEYCLPALENLKLVGLYCLEQIQFKGITANDFFPNLRSVQIFHCYEIKNVNWLLLLRQLLHLELQFCEAIESLIDDTSLGHRINEIEEEQQMLPILPRLKTLCIHSSDSLTCLYRGSLVNIPALEILEITQCSNLTRLNIQPQSKLKEIRGGEKWWRDLHWDNDHIKGELEPYFRAPRQQG